jgi:hypothetical protein
VSTSSSFVFYTERRLVELTGLRARTLPELLELIREVPGSSIFYHTHQQYLTLHFEKPVFYNDFAIWVTEALQLPRLGEKLAAADLLSFTSVRQLREALVEEIEEALKEDGALRRECPPGSELHFCRSKSFIMRTGIIAENAWDFFSKLDGVSNASLYFHFFEARLRLERPTNDFSAWLSAVGEEPAARAIDRLDPYTLTLDELKQEIIRAGKRLLRA